MVRNNLKTKYLDKQEGDSWCGSLFNWSPCLTTLVSVAIGLLIPLVFPMTFWCLTNLVSDKKRTLKCLPSAGTSNH